MSLNWLQQQRSTPSFASAKGSVANEQLGTALDQPLPAALRDFGGDTRGVDLDASSMSRISATNLSSSPYSTNSPYPALGGGVSQRRARTPPASLDGSTSIARSRSAGGYTSKVTDARGVARHLDVFESLVERGKLSAEVKDRMRIDAEKEKLRRCRSVPKINRLNDDYSMAPSTNSIFQRLWNKDQEKKQRHQTKVLIMQKKEEELFATLFQPRISSKGHRSKGSANRATSTEKFSFKTQQRMDEIRKEKIMKEMEMMMDAPDINAKSKLLAQKQREREGLAGYSHIEAMLERDRLNKLARYEQHERELISQIPGTPRITEYAASLHRGNESASERLYKTALQRSRTPNKATSFSGGADGEGFAEGGSAPPALSVSAMSSIYAGGGGGAATPSRAAPLYLQSSQRGRGEATDESAVRNQQQQQQLRTNTHDLSRLFQNDAEMRARREERARRIMEAEARSHTPTINPVSASIAARLPTSTEERLVATTPKRATATTRLSSVSVGSSVAPSEGAARDQRDDAPTSRDLQLFERLRLAEARRKMRIEAARAELEQRREEECTFAPVTTTSYYPPPASRRQEGKEGGAGAGAGAGGGNSLYDRSNQWLQSREERLRKMKETEEEAKNSGFSFQPAISRKTQEIYEKGVYEAPAEEAVAGFDSFVSRHQKVKRSASSEAEDHQTHRVVSSQPWNSSTLLTKAERAAAARAAGDNVADVRNSHSMTSGGDRDKDEDRGNGSYREEFDPSAIIASPSSADRPRRLLGGGGGFSSIYDRR